YPVGESLDPRDAPEPGQLLIATWPVYDRIIHINAESKYEPMLATEWQFSDDATTLALELREDVTFSDGVKFDAEAVKANLEWSKAATGTQLQKNVEIIDEINIVDDYAVELHLSEATTEILETLSSTLGGI